MLQGLEASYGNFLCDLVSALGRGVLQSEVGDQNPTLLEVRAISLVKQGYIVVLGKAAALVDLA